MVRVPVVLVVKMEAKDVIKEKVVGQNYMYGKLAAVCYIYIIS